jgi:hypothetical protein
LQEYLTKQDHQPQLQKETNQVYIIFKQEGRDFPLFFRIFEGGELLQLLIFIPCSLRKTAANDLARLLVYLNKELDIPGFGMDESSSLVFFRVMIPAYDGGIPEKILDSMLSSIRTICQTFAPVVAAVATGTNTFEDVLKKIRESQPNPPSKLGK